MSSVFSAVSAAPTINMAATGANIRSLLKARGLKVADVQAICGFNTPQAIFKWMRGDAMGVRFSQRKPHNSVSFNGRTPVFEAVNGSSILPTEIMGVSHSGNCT